MHSRHSSSFKAIKIRASSHAGTLDEATDRVRLTRKAVGKDVRLLVAATSDWDVATAVRMMHEWEKHDILVPEEPLPMEEMSGFVRPTALTPVPVATGVRFCPRWEFMHWIKSKAVSAINPSVMSCGGVLEWMKIAGIANMVGTPVIPHAVPQIHVHLLAASPAATLLEYFPDDMPVFGGFFNQLFNVSEEFLQVRVGCVGVPQRPGLGLEINEDLAAKYRVAETKEQNLKGE